MTKKKNSAFLLLSILQEESDENHILSVGELMTKLENQYGLKVERRTIYANIDMLKEIGYEISDYNDNGQGYYLYGRQFEKGEVLLLCNAIHASHFINQKQSEELIQKLLSTQSAYSRGEYRNAVYLPNDLKSENKVLFYNIEMISEAIQNNKMISFQYNHYNSRAKLEPRRPMPYTVEPRYIIYKDMRPYLISTNEKYTGFTHWRIDKISRIQVLDSNVRKLTKAKQAEAYEYAKNKLFMFAGDMEWVSFRCESRIMDQMVDIFGPRLRILNDDSEHFTVKVQTTENGALFLAQQYMDAVEIVDPAYMREKFVARLQEVSKKYLGNS